MTTNVRHGGDYYKPDDFLGGGGPSEVKRPSVANKQANLGTNKSGLDKPDFFLGGCSDQTSPRHKVKLRDSWLQPKDDSRKAPAPLLSSVEKPEDYLGGSVPDMNHHQHDSDDETKNTKTTASSIASYQKPEEFGAASDHKPESPKKPVSPKKQQQTVTVNAHTQSVDYHPSEFLGGSEPKPIKKWTPPKKQEEPVQTKSQNDISWDHPQGFLGGSEPKPIKKWKPPKKQEEPVQTKTRNDISWDQPQGFLGGSEPKPIKRWTPPPKDQRVPAPWEMAKTAGNKTATRRNSFGNKEKKSAPARNNPRASWVADTVNRNSMDADKDEDKHDHDQELSMDQLEIQHKEDKAAGAAKWGMSEPNFGYSADHDEEEEHMSFNNSAVFEKVEEEPELPKATRRWSKPAPPEEKLMSTTQPNVDVRNQSMDYHPSDFLGGSEPKPIKKWTPLKKEEEPAHKQTAHFSADNAHTQSIDTHPSGFLGGCEPKPIKKWTPPPKESAVPAPWEMSSGKTGGTNGRGSMKKDAHPDAFMGGCEPKPIKKWTPPKKEDSDKRLHGSVNDITWDHPTGFLGGSEPKPIKKWTPPPKESAVPAPWEISSGKAGGNNRDSVKSASDDFMGGCEPEQVKKWKPIKKEDSDRRLHGSVNDISWDHPQGFLGGCDPAQPKKWTPPTKK